MLSVDFFQVKCEPAAHCNQLQRTVDKFTSSLDLEVWHVSHSERKDM